MSRAGLPRWPIEKSRISAITTAKPHVDQDKAPAKIAGHYIGIGREEAAEPPETAQAFADGGAIASLS